MKQEELVRVSKCCFCGKGIGSSGAIHFYRITLQQFVVDMGAVKRQAGLEQLLGGHARIAQIMGPDEDMAKGLGPKTITVCAACVDEIAPVLVAVEEIESKPSRNHA